MNRRKFIIGAAGAAIGGSALVGSGAFSSVEADRDVEVAVADDSAAFLALEPGAENGAYAQETGGTIEINFDADADVAGAGFNKRAATTIHDVFRVRNQGSQTIKVDLNTDENELPDGLRTFFDTGDQGPSLLLGDDGSGTIIFGIALTEIEANRFTISRSGPNGEATLEPGEEQTVGVALAFEGFEAVGLDEGFSVEISAEATE